MEYRRAADRLERGQRPPNLVGHVPTSAHDAVLVAPILEQRTRTTPGPIHGVHLTVKTAVPPVMFERTLIEVGNEWLT